MWLEHWVRDSGWTMSRVYLCLRYRSHRVSFFVALARRFATSAELADALSTIMAGLEPLSTRGCDDTGETQGKHEPSREIANRSYPSPAFQFPPGYVGECRCFRGHRDYVTGVAFVP